MQVLTVTELEGLAGFNDDRGRIEYQRLDDRTWRYCSRI